MSVQSMLMYLGKIASYQISTKSIIFEVEVIDVKAKEFKRSELTFLIKPVAGSGSAWVHDTSLQFKEGVKDER